MIVSVPTPELAADLTPLPEGVELIVWPMDGAAPREHIDIVVPPYIGMSDALPHLAGIRLGLIQSQSIGYDGLAPLLPAGVPFANAASVHETATAELAVALTVAAQRQLPAFVRAQERGEWDFLFSPGLADHRVLLLGYGGVGKAVAARLGGFEVEVVPVATHARDEDGVHVHGIEELAGLLPTTDILLLTLPGGEATHHIIGDAELAALPDGALVVNVGRGPLIDTDALVRHITAGRLRAALDVMDPEPLPAGHPLWSLPGGPAHAARRRRLTGNGPAHCAPDPRPDRPDARGKAAPQRRARLTRGPGRCRAAAELQGRWGWSYPLGLMWRAGGDSPDDSAMGRAVGAGAGAQGVSMSAPVKRSAHSTARARWAAR